MAFPVKLALALTLIALPILEIALLIKAGSVIGVWATVAIVLATAVLGANVIRRSGMAVFSRMFANIEAGGSGVDALIDQALVVTGGVLLILPGLLGDAVGALLLLPPVRTAMRGAMRGLVKVQAIRVEPAAEAQQTPARTPRPHRMTPGRDGGLVIDGEWERVDEKTPRGGKT